MIAYGKHLRVSFSNTKEDGAGREGEDEFQVADPVRDLHNSETAISMCLGINAKRQEYTHGKRWRIVTKKHNFIILYDDVYIYYLLFLYTSKLRLKHCFFSFSGLAGCEPASLVVLLILKKQHMTFSSNIFVCQHGLWNWTPQVERVHWKLHGRETAHHRTHLVLLKGKQLRVFMEMRYESFQTVGCKRTDTFLKSENKHVNINFWKRFEPF